MVMIFSETRKKKIRLCPPFCPYSSFKPNMPFRQQIFHVIFKCTSGTRFTTVMHMKRI